MQEWILIATSASNGEAEVSGVYHAVWISAVKRYWWFHNRFSQSRRRSLLGHYKDTMLNGRARYDFCIGVPMIRIVS